MKIAFVGDLFTGGQLIENEYYKKEIEIADFKSADFRICNLEQSISNNSVITNKSTILSPTQSLDFLSNNSISIVSLANNHIQDTGESGFLEGIEFLRRKRIRFVGAGKNIHDAEKPLSIDDSLALLAYCDYSKPYLKKVQLASETTYGVNPLSYDKVMADLSKIGNQQKAILLIHWGEENLWFPPYSNIKLAKCLLEHPQVHSIIGTHPHKIQGRIWHNGKPAYMSLGNFLFPNFYLAPRTQIVYPEACTKHKITKEYHPVFSLTLKKWRYTNRLSLVLSLENNNYHETIVKQHKELPSVRPLSVSEKKIASIYFSILSSFLILPKAIYIPIAGIINSISKARKLTYIIFFYILKEKITLGQLRKLIAKNG